MRGELDPAGAAVRPLQLDEILGDGAIGRQPLQKRLAGLRVIEPRGIERTHIRFRGLRTVAEDEFEVRVRGERARSRRADEANVDALVYGVEQPDQRVGSRFGAGIEVARGHRRRLYGRFLQVPTDRADILWQLLDPLTRCLARASLRHLDGGWRVSHMRKLVWAALGAAVLLLSPASG